MRASSDKVRGFTVIELIVVITVLGVLIGVVIGSLGDYYQANVDSAKQTNLDTNTRGTLRQIEAELANVSGFMPSIAVSAPLGAKSGGVWGANWDYRGMGGDYADRRVLIAGIPATTGSQDDSGRLPVFSDPSGACPADPTSAMVVKNTLVYFLAPDSGSSPSLPPSRSNPYNLYRRTIVPAGPYCYGATPFQRTTCAAGVAHVVCNASDALLLRDVRSLTIDYYLSPSASGTISGQYTASPSNPISDAQSIVITIETGQLINGNETAKKATIRISRLQ